MTLPAGRFFTSDTHFGHRNILPYCERPFSSLEVMEAELIRRWNIVVGPTDTIYHLGDFGFCRANKTAEILAKLNGHKILVMGNHDSNWTVGKWIKLGFQEVINRHGTQLEIGGQVVFLSHFPYQGAEADKRDFSKYQFADDGSWLLCGHVHKAWKQKNRTINVGVDQWAYAPVSEGEILGAIGLTPPSWR